MSAELDGLRAAAIGATRGGWVSIGSSSSQEVHGHKPGSSGTCMAVARDDMSLVVECTAFGRDSSAEVAYIAAASPDVVLALIARVEVAEAAVETWKHQVVPVRIQQIDALRRAETAEAAVARVRATLSDPRHRWWHTGGAQCSPLYAVRDALNGPEAASGDAGSPVRPADGLSGPEAGRDGEGL